MSDDKAVYLFTDAQYDTPTYSVMTHQNPTFWGEGTWGGAYDLQIRT